MNDFTDIDLENLRWMLDDLWVDRSKSVNADVPTLFSQALNSRIRSEVDLFVFCWHYPWSYAWGLISHALSHPKCSQSVARNLYWQCSPSYLYRRKEKGQQFRPDDLVCWNLLGEIEEGIQVRRWQPGSIAFSPSDVFGKPIRDDDVANPGNRLVPAEMKRCVDGRVVDIRALHELIYGR